MSAPEFELPAVEAPFEVPHLDPQAPPGDPVAQDGGILVPPAAGADAAPTYVPQAVLEADAKLASSLLDLTPGIGTVKGLIEAFTGEDLVTGEHQSWWERGLNVAAAIPDEPFEEGSRVAKIVEAIHHVDDVIDLVHVGQGIQGVNEASEQAAEGAGADGAGGQETGGLAPPPALPH